MRKLVMKCICMVLIALLSVTGFTACGSGDTGAGTGTAAVTTDNTDTTGSSDSSTQTEKLDLTGTKVTFWNGFTASDGDILREIFDEFNKTNEMGIEVQMDIMPWANLFEKLAPALATGTAPTLLLLGSEMIPEYAESDGLIVLDDFWSISGLDQSIYAQNVQDAFKYKGNVFGIPMQYNTQYLYWNKDLFFAAGLDPENPPKNFSELKQFAAKLTDKSKEQYGFGIATGSSNITNFLWSNGGDWLNNEQTKAVCNSKETIEVLTMLQGFAKDGHTPVGMSGADMDNLLLSGRLGMYINGPWLINGLRTNGINFGIGAVPAADNGNLQVPGGGVAFMVTASADEKEKAAAYECIKYWLSKDVLKEWSMKNGIGAWSEEVLADPEILNDPIQKVLGPLSKYGRLPFAGMPEYGQITGDYLDPLFEQLMYNKITPEDCARQMAEGIDSILSK